MQIAKSSLSVTSIAFETASSARKTHGSTVVSLLSGRMRTSELALGSSAEFAITIGLPGIKALVLSGTTPESLASHVRVSHVASAGAGDTNGTDDGNSGAQAAPVADPLPHPGRPE